NVLPRGLSTAFALPAQFVEADRREGADERKARSERVEERYDFVIECYAGQEQANEGIDDGEENDMGRHRHEVVDAFRHRVLQIRNPDLADDGVSRALARTRQHMDIWHDQDLPRPFFERSRGSSRPNFFHSSLLVTRVPQPAELSVAAAAGIVFTISARFQQLPRCMSRMRGALSGPC